MELNQPTINYWASIISMENLETDFRNEGFDQEWAKIVELQIVPNSYWDSKERGSNKQRF